MIKKNKKKIKKKIKKKFKKKKKKYDNRFYEFWASYYTPNLLRKTLELTNSTLNSYMKLGLISFDLQHCQATMLTTLLPNVSATT